MAKKKIDTAFVDSIANNKQFQPASLEELENNNNIDEEEEEANDENEVEDKQKGKKTGILDILKTKPAGKLKPIPVPDSVHRKVAQLSGVCDFGISDITSSALLYLLDNHKDEIKKLIQKQMREEWK